MSDGAPAADSSGNFMLTGNGPVRCDQHHRAQQRLRDSLLPAAAQLNMNQYFTPMDQATDDSGDQDFGAGGAALLADLPNIAPCPV